MEAENTHTFFLPSQLSLTYKLCSFCFLLFILPSCFGLIQADVILFLVSLDFVESSFGREGWSVQLASNFCGAG